MTVPQRHYESTRNRHGKRRLVGFIFLSAFAWATALPVFGQNTDESTVAPVAEIPPFVIDTVETYCLDCHAGSSPDADLSLDELIDAENFNTHRDEWEKVLRMVRSREMPPDEVDPPHETERYELVQWINSRLDEIECGDDVYPGRVTIRRLNRVEYNNTIRDLTGVDFSPADDFPSDDVGNGFDNMGEVLSMPPLLVEKYLEAAEAVVDSAFESEAGRELIIICEPANDTERVECATRIVRRFATRAFRRPITEDELQRYMELARRAYEQGASYNDSLKYVCKAILVSPYFLFKVEQDPSEQEQIRQLSDFELAVRLSYFLWSSMPDEELFRLAQQGELSRDDVLIGQVQRMLNDSRSDQFVENFAGQWLQLRRLDEVIPDPDMFPGYDVELSSSMRRETESFFRTIMREDRSVLEFLNADFTYVDQRLADHYAIEFEGDGWQRVSLPANRRGVLTHASILVITSNPTRTSPVKRGKWILDNILGEPPPPPPDGVQELEEQPELLGSLRERMEQHREDPGCAVCHRTMDALGFGLENFDVTGAWRDQDGRHEIDPAGALPGSVEFATSGELMQILAENKSEEFCRCLIEKSLTYGIGRGLQPYDRCTVNAVYDHMLENGFRFQSMIEAIVLSDPFRKQAKTKDRP